MKKRILSCLMALALCLTLLPTAALAEETEGTAQTPPVVEEAADLANGEAKQESQPAEAEQEDTAVKRDEAVAAVQVRIDALLTRRNWTAWTTMMPWRSTRRFRPPAKRIMMKH